MPHENRISTSLEVTLHTLWVEARHRRHAEVTVEHLLLALIDHDPAAADLMSWCRVDLEELRRALEESLKRSCKPQPGTEELEPQPTLAFQRVIQRSLMHVNDPDTRATEVTGGEILIAIFGETKSDAVELLRKQNVSRLQVLWAHFSRQGWVDGLASALPPTQHHSIVVKFPDGKRTFDRVTRCTTWEELEAALSTAQHAVHLVGPIALQFRRTVSRSASAKSTRLTGHLGLAASAIGAAASGGVIPVLQGILGTFAKSIATDQLRAVEASTEGRLVLRAIDAYEQHADLDEDGSILLFND